MWIEMFQLYPGIVSRKSSVYGLSVLIAMFNQTWEVNFEDPILTIKGRPMSDQALIASFNKNCQKHLTKE
jgi:hypothetical protein